MQLLTLQILLIVKICKRIQRLTPCPVKQIFFVYPFHHPLASICMISKEFSCSIINEMRLKKITKRRKNLPNQQIGLFVCCFLGCDLDAWSVGTKLLHMNNTLIMTSKKHNYIFILVHGLFRIPGIRKVVSGILHMRVKHIFSFS